MLIPKNNANQMRTRILVKIVEKFYRDALPTPTAFRLSCDPRAAK